MVDSDRILGCIVGGAIGDAAGGPYEGCASPVRINDEAEWRLSDDTQLTLATCEAVVAAGGDTDTIASMAGQVAGAFVGYESLPNTMLDRLPEKAMITRIASELATFIERA